MAELTRCIADGDQALVVMRLIVNEDVGPRSPIGYALAPWDRRSVRRDLADLPTTR